MSAHEQTYNYPSILGLDIGGTKTALVLGTLSAQILRRMEFPTPVDVPFKPAFEKITDEIDRFLNQCRDAGLSYPAAMSIAVGGPLNIDEGILHSPPHLKNWGDAPLKQSLFQRFKIPVFVEHDGNAGALAEYYFGAGQGAHNMIFITMGTGFGAGIILNDAIYHGSSDASGEVGHIRLMEDGPVEYGKAGSWEAFCSGAGIVKYGRWKYPDIFNENTTTRQIVEQALAGKPEAVKLITDVGQLLGKGLAILVDILNPDVIIMGTLAVILGDLVLEPARKVIQQEALPVSASACKVVPAKLGNSLMDIGCLMAVYDAYRKEKAYI